MSSVLPGGLQAPSSVPGRVRRLRRLLLGIPASATDFDTRGFRAVDPAVRRHLEGHAAAFVAGYHAALAARGIPELAGQLALLATEERGFAAEGAAMACTLLDGLWPSGRRLQGLLDGPGTPYVYLVHVGAGWAVAHLRRLPRRAAAALDPLLRWLVFDGFGFHQGFFHPRRYLERQRRPRLRGYSACVFDQGLGRALWFYAGARSETVVDLVGSFPRFRQPDLWSGVGLAATYAGGAALESLVALRARAGSLREHVAQGAVFAATARVHGRNATAETDLACGALAGLAPRSAAALAARAAEGCTTGSEGDYERWRAAIRAGLPDAGERVR